ncbi:serine/threonine protein kinase, partial [Streptomyces sp. Ncost-T6T-2b]
MLIGAILIGRVIFSENEGDNQVKAPNLVGSTLEEAQTLADRTGVTVQKGADEPCEQQEKGQICSQDPKADAMMDKDGTVTVVVSSGAPQIEVPNVLEKSEDGAREVLEGDGFTVNVTTEESDKPEGTVIKQNPKGGQKADEESEVTITLAVQATLDLPDMRTRTFEAAEQQLRGIGFTNISRTDVESDKPAGEVIEQTPTGPSKQGKDVQIVLKVSKGPAEPEKVQIPGDIGNRPYQEVKAQLEGL